jgi:hypothetical protein
VAPASEATVKAHLGRLGASTRSETVQCSLRIPSVRIRKTENGFPFAI